MFYKFFAALVLTYLFSINHVVCLTDKQLVATARMTRNVCQPKTKATDEDIDKMHKGNWDIDYTAMCYMQCCLSMNKLISKENKLDYESTLVQVKILPERLQEPTLKCAGDCKDSAVTLDDKCKAAYEISKCVYFCNPEKYFLP